MTARLPARSDALAYGGAVSGSTRFHNIIILRPHCRWAPGDTLPPGGTGCCSCHASSAGTNASPEVPLLAVQHLQQAAGGGGGEGGVVDVQVQLDQPHVRARPVAQALE